MLRIVIRLALIYLAYKCIVEPMLHAPPPVKPPDIVPLSTPAQ